MNVEHRPQNRCRTLSIKRSSRSLGAGDGGVGSMSARFEWGCVKIRNRRQMKDEFKLSNDGEKLGEKCSTESKDGINAPCTLAFLHQTHQSCNHESCN